MRSPSELSSRSVANDSLIQHMKLRKNPIALLSLIVSLLSTAHSATLTVNPDTGQISNGGAFASSVTWNGVTISAGSLAGGVYSFNVAGNFTVNATDIVTATDGTGNAVRFNVTGDANIASGATFNFSANTTTRKSGGGTAGGAGSASATQTTVGSGGAAGSGGTTGGGGSGGGIAGGTFGGDGGSTFVGSSGGNGTSGATGGAGQAGFSGGGSTAGGAGINGSNGGAAVATGGTGGGAGFVQSTVGALGSGGAGGSGAGRGGGTWNGDSAFGGDGEKRATVAPEATPGGVVLLVTREATVPQVLVAMLAPTPARRSV
jgi:hypothetical protein